MISPRAVFRIVYGTSYFLLYFILLVLLLITPGDAIYQAVVNQQNYNIWIVAVAYVVTVSAVIFIYALRLYVNKTALASIPKAWMPIAKGDVPKTVYKMINMGLNRSAAISFDARPRVAPAAADSAIGEDRNEESRDGEVKERKRSFQLLRLQKSAAVEDELGIALPPHRPVWGEIEHFGWASPNSPDLPDLQYSTVFSELPNLIEAKALTLAPADGVSEAEPPMLDAQAVALLLQRPLHMGLRDYVGYLTELGVVVMSAATADFITMYEYARFSTRAISNARFREIMRLFAEILRTMQPLDPAILQSFNRGIEGTTESDIDNDAPLRTNPGTPSSSLTRSNTNSSSWSQVQRPLPESNSWAETWQRYHTTT
jgi:hypothetical protein